MCLRGPLLHRLNSSYGGVNSPGAGLSIMGRIEVGIRGPWPAKVLCRPEPAVRATERRLDEVSSLTICCTTAKVTLYVECVSECESVSVCVSMWMCECVHRASALKVWNLGNRVWSMNLNSHSVWVKVGWLLNIKVHMNFNAARLELSLVNS